MTQRYRAILHLVDPIIEAGHELTIVVSGNHVNLKMYRDYPCNVSASSKGTIKYLMDAFGVYPQHFDKVKFTTNKKIKADLYLCYDNHNKNAVGIPYNTRFCHVDDKKILTGNPMEDMFTSDHLEDSLLIIHPGGGRGYVSPQRRSLSKKKTIKNNVAFLQMVIDNLPDNISYITIKSHPFPYKACSENAIKKYVVPRLKFCGKIKVKSNDLIGLISYHEYIINFGGTTSLWLGKTDKKWVNIIGMDKFNASREKLIPSRGGGIRLENLKQHHWKRDEQFLDSGNAIENIMKVINGEI